MAAGTIFVYLGLGSEQRLGLGGFSLAGAGYGEADCGLFCGVASDLIIAAGDGVEHRERPWP